MPTKSAHALSDLFVSAAEVLVTPDARQKYAHWADVIGAPAVKPLPPTTRDGAVPHVLLRGPFKGDPDLVGVAFYVGIGFIEVRAFDTTHYTYETSVIGGDGIEERDAFLMVAREFFFHDVKFQPEVHA